MLKVRIIPILLLKGPSLVKSVGFKEHRIVGDAISAIKVFSQRFADEMIILDLEAAERGRINSDLLSRVSEFCNMPLSFGGGVDSLEKANTVYEAGADKIIVNSVFFKDPSVVEDMIVRYGSQAVILSVDVRCKNGTYNVYYANGTKLDEGADLFKTIESAQKMGVGEVFVNSIDRDGRMSGFDLRLIKKVREVTRVPLLVAGGCGSVDDFKSAFDLNVDAVCAGSIFHWVGESIVGIKRYLKEMNINVRIV